MTEKSKRKTYHEEFAEKVIKALQKNEAPWQKPWEPGVVHPPFNPVSKNVYKGSNCVNLVMNGFDDPRYLTFKQANSQDYRVKKGEKAHRVVYYVFEEEQTKLDDNGREMLDSEGQVIKEKVQLDRPKACVAGVFHMTQLEGVNGKEIEPWTAPVADWNPEERAEKILANSGVPIFHDQHDRAYYSPAKDEIHTPPLSKFKEASRYYATALHELAHATGHETRLDRHKDFKGPFGSEAYAKEELRAEIASWMIGQELGVGHDPENHSAYVKTWIKTLKEDPYEIVRACRDAEKIKTMVLGMEMELQKENVQRVKPETVLERENNPENGPGKVTEKSPDQSPTQLPTENLAQEKTYLAVPYIAKNKAKSAGAKWDKEAKLWYAPAGTDLEQLKQFMPDKAVTPAVTMFPQEEFRQALQEMGFDLKGEKPIMDGKIQRVGIEGRAPGNKDGAYCGYPDATVPAGWMQNYASGEKTNWKASGHVLTEEQKQQIKIDAELRKEARQAEIQAQQDIIAQKCQEYFNDRYPASSGHAYLQAKGVEPHGIKESPHGNELLVPLQNKDGEIRSIQYIAEDGSKHFESGGQKKGCFHMIGAPSQNSPYILAAEGYATGASLHQATGLPVAIAFDAGNLKPVAVALKEKFPSSTLMICADNDHSNKFGNVGVEKAQEAALAANGKVVIPQFSAEEISKGLKDFNDLHKSQGIKKVQSQIIEQTLSKKLSKSKDSGITL